MRIRFFYLSTDALIERNHYEILWAKLEQIIFYNRCKGNKSSCFRKITIVLNDTFVWGCLSKQIELLSVTSSCRDGGAKKRNRKY